MRPGPWAPQPGPCSRRGRCCQQCAPTWGRPPLEPCCSPCRLSVPTKRPSNTLRGRGAGSRGTPGPGLGCTVACGALGSNSSCLLPICSDKILSGGDAWPGEDPLGRVGPWVPMERASDPEVGVHGPAKGGAGCGVRSPGRVDACVHVGGVERARELATHLPSERGRLMGVVPEGVQGAVLRAPHPRCCWAGWVLAWALGPSAPGCRI